MKDAPQKRKPVYTSAWNNAVNRFTREFVEDFCFKDGSINWEKLTQFVSGTKQPLLRKRKVAPKAS